MELLKRNKVIIRLVKKKIAYRKIGEQFGISKQAVHQIAKKYGLTSRLPTPETGLIQTTGYKLRKRIRKFILERDRYICHYCGKQLIGSDATIDHKIPTFLDGTHDHNNLVAACKHCNSQKNTKTSEEFILYYEKIKISNVATT